MVSQYCTLTFRINASFVIGKSEYGMPYSIFISLLNDVLSLEKDKVVVICSCASFRASIGANMSAALPRPARRAALYVIQYRAASSSFPDFVVALRGLLSTWPSCPAGGKALDAE